MRPGQHTDRAVVLVSGCCTVRIAPFSIVAVVKAGRNGRRLDPNDFLCEAQPFWSSTQVLVLTDSGHGIQSCWTESGSEDIAAWMPAQALGRLTWPRFDSTDDLVPEPDNWASWPQCGNIEVY